MTIQRLFLTLLCCILILGQGCAHETTNTPGQKVKSQETTDAALREKFKKIKEGMTEQAVLGVMGDPQHKEGTIWEYFLNRAPKPGEQLMIYQIFFANHKVAEKRVVGGPDATGPAPH